MFLNDVPYLIHLASGIEISGRIVRVADKDRLGPLGDELFELLYRRKGETCLDR